MDQTQNLSDDHQQQEAWLASFPEKNPYPILEINLNGRIEYTNPAVRRLFPTLLDLQTDHPYLAGWGEITDRFRNQQDLVITQDVSVGEETYQQSIYFVEENQRLRVYGMNISKRKRLETELRKSEQKYRELVQYAPAGIYEVDFRTQKFVTINDAMCILTGYSRDELMALNPMDILDEPSRQLFRKRIQKWLAGEEPEKNVEYRVLAKDGHEIFAELNVTFTTDEKGQPVGATVIGHDITERKQAEQALQWTNQTLQMQAEELEIQSEELQNQTEELIQANQKLQESEERFRLALKNMPVMVANLDRDLRYTWIYNPLGGFKPEDAIGQRVGLMTEKESSEAMHLHLQEVISKGVSAQWETTTATKIGGRSYISYAEPLHNQDGEITGIGLVSVDITERKQAEALDKALNRIHRTIHSHLNFEQIMQRSLADAAKTLECDSAAISLRKGADWIPTYVYGLGLDVLGTKMNADEERHAILAIQTKQPVAVEDAFNDERFSREHLRKWGIRSVLVVPILLKNRAIGVLFFNYQKSIYHFQEMHIDFGKQLAASISLALENTRLIENLQEELNERKQAEEALAEVNALLEQRVQERTVMLESLMGELKQTAQDLQSANVELEAAQEELMTQNEELAGALEKERSLRLQLIQAEKFAALARLLASVAHEINNPLQTVKNSLYLLAPVIPPGNMQEILSMAIHETRRIGALVQQLHETYQPHYHQPIEFNLVVVIRKLFTLLSPQLKQSNVEWQLHNEQDCLNIQGIQDQIQQVCLNICINAIDAMGSKGGQLRVEVSKPEPGRACISFSDTGPGIAERDRARIFEPFFTTKEKGLGLGLPICYEIVKDHGGEITVESELGKGTTFKVWLPIQS